MFQNLKQWTAERRGGVTLVVTILISVVLLIRGGQSGPTIIRWGALRIVSAGQSILAFPIHLGRLERENRYLRGELLRTVLYDAEIRRLRAENTRLRQMVSFREATPLQLRAADVLGHGSELPPTVITINIGSRDGVRDYQAVVTPEGLAGRIEPGPASHMASVRLISDQGIRVSAVVDNPERPMGIVRWENDGLRLGNVPVELPVSQNEAVITSGLGGIFPEGVLIGYVSEVVEDPHALFKEVTVRPAARLDRLEEVFVVRTSEDDTPVGSADVLDR